MRHLTKEKCLEIARGYKVPNQWRDKDYRSYSTAKVMGWMKDCTAHMKYYFKYTYNITNIVEYHYTECEHYPLNDSNSYNSYKVFLNNGTIERLWSDTLLEMVERGSIGNYSIISEEEFLMSCIS